MWQLHPPPPPWKKSPPLSQQPRSKSWGPVKPLPLTMSLLQEKCFIQKGSQNLKCWLMLLFIANRANMWVWLTMLTNIYLKFNKCWPIFFDFFFLPQHHVGDYSKLHQHVGQHIDQQWWFKCWPTCWHGLWEP